MQIRLATPSAVRRLAATAGLIGLALVSLAVAHVVHAASNVGAPRAPHNAFSKAARADLIAPLQKQGEVRVIIGLQTPQEIAQLVDPTLDQIKEQRVATRQSRVLQRLAGHNLRNVKRLRLHHFLAASVDAAALQALLADAEVTSVTEDRPVYPVLHDTPGITRADGAWTAGHRGAGQTVAIIDSGVDESHPFFSGKVVAEACFSQPAGSNTSYCPNGISPSFGPGTGAQCPDNDLGCWHGTHVAGIAAGRYGVLSSTTGGIAPDAEVIAIQVFQRQCAGNNCGILAYDSDVLAALDHVYSLRTTYDIASVNMSIGGDLYTSQCDDSLPAYKSVIDSLRSVNIAVVAAAGNDGNAGAIAAPACVSNAISVGSATKQNAVSSFSNSASFLSLLAPGSSVTSSVPGGYGQASGTSMATPHVAGAWAVLKSAKPSAAVAEVLTALQNSGVPITDPRNGIVKSLIQIGNTETQVGALGVLLGATPSSVSLSVSPTSVAAGGNVTVSWSGIASPSSTDWIGLYTAGAADTAYIDWIYVSCSKTPGAPRASGSCAFAIPAGLASGNYQLRLLANDGFSALASAAFTVTDIAPTTLGVSPTSVAAGGSVTASWSGIASPSSTDWIGLYTAGAANTAFIDWIYVSCSKTPGPPRASGSCPFGIPDGLASGTYELRLLANNGFMHLAISESIAVSGAGTAPAIALQNVASGLSSPVGIEHAGDGSGRLFVVQQGGQIRILTAGGLLPTAFLDIQSLIVSGGERGLLGLAFHPNYVANGFFYINYTRLGDGATVIARYQRSAGNPDLADPGSALVLLTVAQPFANHKGGQLRFGPDGYLYIALGDGGSANDPGNRAQNLSTLLGKMLRIDVDSALPYAIPAGNPFKDDGNPNTLGEIWAYGLRNPWRFSFDRSTGDLFIADVGQSAREEINFQPVGAAGGANYGWRVMEGTQCTGLGGSCPDPAFTLPVLEYSHALGCSITGGHRYRGPAYPALTGFFLYGDFCSGRIWGAGGNWTTTELLVTGFNISTFGEDETGEIYVAAYNAGAIYRIVRP